MTDDQLNLYNVNDGITSNVLHTIFLICKEVILTN